MVNQTPIISVRGLKTQFGSKIVHQDLSLDVMKGECLALVGGSGCGKSVLLRSFIGLETPAEGTCLFQERDLFKLSEHEFIEVRKKIAYAFQWGALFDSLTVEDNLSYPLREHTHLSENEIKERVITTLKMFGLENTERLLPGSLSGGMQKRVGLARAIMLDPEIILYDEPTAGLDPSNARNINDMIIKLKNTGKTSVLVTHDMASARSTADRIAYLYQGKIAETQAIGELNQRPLPLIKSFMSGEERL